MGERTGAVTEWPAWLLERFHPDHAPAKPPTVADEVAALEARAQRLERLVGDILCTLEMPRNRVALTQGVTAEHLDAIVGVWRREYDRARALRGPRGEVSDEH